MARRASSRYGDWATGDAQSKPESPESSLQRRALERPSDCLAGRKGVARGDRVELLPEETSLEAPPSVLREVPAAIGSCTCRGDDKEGVRAAFEGAASSTSSSSSTSPSKTSSTTTSE
jgi:hypothetical protein